MRATTWGLWLGPIWSKNSNGRYHSPFSEGPGVLPAGDRFQSPAPEMAAQTEWSFRSMMRRTALALTLSTGLKEERTPSCKARMPA